MDKEKKLRDEEVEKMGEKDVLACFQNICAEMLMGKTNEDEIERVTKAMVRTKQHEYMKKEFEDITNILLKNKVQ
jgi:hypothetical protein